MNPNTNLTVTGVDLGSSSVKIAAVLKGGVQIITNEANFRQTPNVVGFGQNQRLIGEAGQLKIKSNHSNTVTAPSRFLGFDKTCPYLSQELKFCPARAQKMQGQNSRLTFNLQYGSEIKPFTQQQLVASYLTEVEKIIAQTNNLANKNLVVTVPSYFTQHERKALLDAVQICKKKLNNEYATQLVNEEIAISMEYGYPKRNEFSEDLQKSKKVLFIDFGHSKTNVFVTAFNKQHLRVIANKFDRQLGCKFMDVEVLKFYANQFDSAHPNMELNLLESKKAVLKLMENIEKQRKVLSGIAEHDLNIECLMEDEDLYYSMKRDQYQKICQPVIQKFRSLLATFFNELKQKGITFDFIEMIGGGTRIPAIYNTIQEVFGQEPSRTINSNECVAKGAALISAMNSSIFRVQPYSFFMTSPYTIQLKANNQKLEKNLVDKNELLIKEKSVEYEVETSAQRLTFLAEYQSEDLQKGLQTKLFECLVQIQPKQNYKNVEASTEMKEESSQMTKTKLNVTISFDQSGLILLNTINSVTNEAGVKVSKINYFEKYSQAELSQMEQMEKQMTIKDLKIKKFYDKKNQYESLIYKTKHSIDNIVSANPEYVSEAQANEIKAFVNAQQNWLSSEIQMDDGIKAGEFAKREKNMANKFEQWSASINQLKQSHASVDAELQKLADLLNEVISKRSQNMYPEEVDRAGEWINQIFQKQKSSSKSVAPVVSVEQVKQIYQDLVQKINQFDQQMERQRQMNARRQKQPQQRNPQGTFYRPETSYQPNSGYGGRQYENDYYRPKTRNNRGGYSNTNPFGSFFGSGFF